MHHPNQSVAIPAGAANLAQAYADQKRKALVTAIVIACMALLAFMGLAASGAFKPLAVNATNPGVKVLQAEGSLPPSGPLNIVANNAGPVLETPATAPAGMPPDVRAWLEHLHQTEIKRVDTTKDMLGDAVVEQAKQGVVGGVDSMQDILNGIDDPNSETTPPTAALERMVKGMHDKYALLIDYFDGPNPPCPEECQPIKAAYDHVLNETTGELGDLADDLSVGDMASTNDMAAKAKKLEGTKGQSSGQIDAYGSKTDRLVGEICAKYNTAKWFEVSADISAGGALGVGGGL
jgi:hypothetical protein